MKHSKFLNRACGAVFLAAFICVAMALPAHAAQRKCTQELRDGHAAFLKKLRAHNFTSGAASGSGKAARAMTQWLKDSHADTVRHEEAHKRAAGKWAGTTEYFYYTWWNIPYATAGCHKFKRGIPLEVAIKSALAPEKPSYIDLRLAKKWQAELDRKNGKR